MRRTSRVALTLVGVAVLTAVSIAEGPIAAADQSRSVNVPIAHIEGRGHGHGVGMSQWGAFTMARDGAAAADIISAFYPGTALGTSGGEVVVVIEEADRVAVQLPQGGEIRASRGGESPPPGFPVRVAPGETVELVVDDAGYHVRGGTVAPMSSAGTRFRTASASSSSCLVPSLCPDDGDPGGDDPGSEDPGTEDPDSGDPDSGDPGTEEPGGGAVPAPTTAPGDPDGDTGGGDDDGDSPDSQDPDPTTSTTEPGAPRSSSPLWAVPGDGGTVRSVGRGRSYRGLFEFTGGPGSGRLRNHVDVEHYVAGMAEVPGHWPPAAVQAQAIVARTFALRAMALSGEICDTESCQVYTGVSHESPGQRAAVAATAGVVVTYQGGLAATYYSASGGGHSATPLEGFGTGGEVPYLPAKPYETANPKPWALDVALADVAARVGYPGTIEDIRIDRAGPSGRAVAMTIVGDAGEQPVDPQEFRRQLGLQSTLFTVTSSQAEEPPPPPPEPDPDPGVVGPSVSPEETPGGVRPAVRRRLPTHLATESASLPRPHAVDEAPPVALVGVAAALIAAIGAAGALHVGSRRRLHPLFALGSVLADLSAGAARSRVRAGGRRLATMAGWILRRR